MLAVRLSIVMGKSLRWVLCRSPAEWALYTAFYGLEPFGPRQEDLRASVVSRSMSGGAVESFFGVFPSLTVGPRQRGGCDAFRAYATARTPALTATSGAAR